MLNLPVKAEAPRYAVFLIVSTWEQPLVTRQLERSCLALTLSEHHKLQKYFVTFGT